jgi:hypothetical protein
MVAQTVCYVRQHRGNAKSLQGTEGVLLEGPSNSWKDNTPTAATKGKQQINKNYGKQEMGCVVGCLDAKY